MPDHHKYRRKLHYAAHQNPLYTVVAMQTPRPGVTIRGEGTN
ncbi:hypothetical protein AAZX31_18G082700 [Glycine max]